MDEDENVVHVVHAIFTVGNTDSRKAKLPRCQVQVGTHETVAVVDTRASINLIAAEEYRRMVPAPTLTKAKVRVYAYGQCQPLALLGAFQTNITHGSQSIPARVYVTEEGQGMLLGCKAAEELGIVTFAFSIHQESMADLLARYKEVFERIGCLKGREIKLHIDKTVQPVALRHRRVAFHLRPQVEKELDQLEKAGIIEKVSGPTPWVSPIVVARKP
ncbi:hypothetical protein NDU88_006704 [Pleurodeles waltl]|uniref:Uncharacterized protein n=1 Tax=Pleurodeles waltl TaxID=8319 RepID=A0AAV7TXW3_PLEWA|nr:hypothetical protein NDU88_006704 [Pleurodeles waltl]